MSQSPPRLQRMSLKLQKYDIKLQYVPGKYMHVADTLSRAYLNEIDQHSMEKAEEMNITIHSLIHSPSIKDDCIVIIREAIEHCETLNLLKKTVYNGWPHHERNLLQMLRPYWNFKASMHIVDDVLFVDNRVIIPKAMQNKMFT